MLQQPVKGQIYKLFWQLHSYFVSSCSRSRMLWQFVNQNQPSDVARHAIKCNRVLVTSPDQGVVSSPWTSPSPFIPSGLGKPMPLRVGVGGGLLAVSKDSTVWSAEVHQAIVWVWHTWMSLKQCCGPVFIWYSSYTNNFKTLVSLRNLLSVVFYLHIGIFVAKACYVLPKHIMIFFFSICNTDPNIHAECVNKYFGVCVAVLCIPV